MNTFRNSEMAEKTAQFVVQAVGNVVAIGVALLLVMAWVITGPFIQLGDRLAQRKFKIREKQ
jgi:low affinity Fe/Cu permease